MGKAMSEPKITPKRTARGFGNYGDFESFWHGRIDVVESSVAFEGACVHVLAEKAYGRTEAPHFHLKYDDAKRLRDLLNVFIRAADAGETREAPTDGSEEDGET